MNPAMMPPAELCDGQTIDCTKRLPARSGEELEARLPEAGEDVLSLAAYAEAHADTEVGMYDVCVRVLTLCRAHAMSVYEYTKMSGRTGVSSEALDAAQLALLHERELGAAGGDIRRDDADAHRLPQ